MKIEPEIKLDFDDVLLKPQRSTISSRKEVKLERDYRFFHSNKTWKGFPLMASNMASLSSFKTALSLNNHKMITCLHKYHTPDQLKEFFANNPLYDYVWPSIGMNEKELLSLKHTGLNDFNICVDVPNGHIEKFVAFCSKVRNSFPNAIIMAGNICITECVQELILHGGVDICKIQIGPGKQCRTRMVTGVGYGTLSCIEECSTVAHGLKSDEKRLGLICSDGGCKTPADICKSFAAGSDFTMVGSILAGTDMCLDNGEWEYDKNTGKPLRMRHYGMSTHYAQSKHSEGRKDYRASEGRVDYVDYAGPESKIIQEIQGGLRSACAYIGSTSLKDMSRCAVFTKVNRIHTNV